MSEFLGDRLLARYLSGECTGAESALVERWADERPERRAAVEQMRRVWEHERIREVPEFDREHSLWRRIAADMTEPTRPRLVRGEAEATEEGFPAGSPTARRGSDSAHRRRLPFVGIAAGRPNRDRSRKAEPGSQPEGRTGTADGGSPPRAW